VNVSIPSHVRSEGRGEPSRRGAEGRGDFVCPWPADEGWYRNGARERDVATGSLTSTC